MLDFGFYNRDCMEGMKEFPDKYFDLAIVDPPYGGVTLGGYATNKISGGVAKNRNDYDLELWAQPAPEQDYFDELERVSKNRIIWGANYYITKIKTDSQCWIAWDKEKPEGVSFADVELAFTSFNSAAKIFRFAWNGMIQGNMKAKEYKIHPTQKPVELYAWILNNFAKPGDKILDTHAGSASSLVACHRLGFQYVGFEIEPAYYEKARDRLEREKAQLSLFD